MLKFLEKYRKSKIVLTISLVTIILCFASLISGFIFLSTSEIEGTNLISLALFGLGVLFFVIFVLLTIYAGLKRIIESFVIYKIFIKKNKKADIRYGRHIFWAQKVEMWKIELNEVYGSDIDKWLDSTW